MKPNIPSDYPFPNHHIYWFLMKIEGARNQRIRIDIKNRDWSENMWNYTVPVYSYFDPRTLDGMHHTVPRLDEYVDRVHQEEERRFKWHRIANRSFDGKTFSFLHCYTRDEVWVAERFPHNYACGQRYLESIDGSFYIKRKIA